MSALQHHGECVRWNTDRGAPGATAYGANMQPTKNSCTCPRESNWPNIFTQKWPDGTWLVDGRCPLHGKPATPKPKRVVGRRLVES